MTGEEARSANVHSSGAQTHRLLSMNLQEIGSPVALPPIEGQQNSPPSLSSSAQFMSLLSQPGFSVPQPSFVQPAFAAQTA
eukprot:7702214-Pyramimonas_sp.AAC.1